jgi:hypothetical protein
MLGLLFDKMRRDAKRKVLQNLNGEYIISADGRTAFLIDTSQNLLFVADESNQLYPYRNDESLTMKKKNDTSEIYFQLLFGMRSEK